MKHQFYKFFNNQLHQIYFIDLLVDQKTNKQYYKARKLPFIHNDEFENAVKKTWNVEHEKIWNKEQNCDEFPIKNNRENG